MRLSARELQDLGINRADIPEIARQAIAGSNELRPGRPPTPGRDGGRATLLPGPAS